MNQKLESLLQVSLAATEEEIGKAPDLQAGYNSDDRTWEVIFLFAGSPEYLKNKYPDIEFKYLTSQYVLAVCSAENIRRIAQEPLVEWLEKPKRLFFEMLPARQQSCIYTFPGSQQMLKGEGVLTAVIDSGIHAADRDFRNADGSSRIRVIYDQTQHREMEQQQISQSLLENRAADIPGRDFSGHGTKVAHIACGNNGVAGKSEIMVVKLGISQQNSFPRTTQLMDAVDYVLKKGIEYGMPVAVNLSFGNNYGDHTGTSLLERFIDDCSMQWKCAFCIGSGNEGLGATHASGILSEEEQQTVELAIAYYELSLSIQIWKEYWDEYEIELISPTGKTTGVLNAFHTMGRIVLDDTKILVHYGEPSPYNLHQEIYLELSALGGYLTAGIWKIRFQAGKIKSGKYDIWLPGLVTLNRGTGFMKPDSNMSCTIPATARRAITVGAYDALTDTMAPFSGRGEGIEGAYSRAVKPELVAPGVGIILEGGESCTGTSFATPVVTGSAALLMEWGIVRGNDPYLYGEKLKAYLIKGARQLPGMESPNPVSGWGALCVYDSIPR